MIFAFGMKVLGWFGLGKEVAKRFAWMPPLILAGLAVWVVMQIASNWFAQALDTAKQAGAVDVVVRGQQQTLTQVKEATNAAEEIRNDVGFARYCQCVRDAAPGFAGSCVREFTDKSLPYDEETAAAACAERGKP